MRVAVYARFSSDKQNETSIDDQVRRCRDWAARAGEKVDDSRVFADYAISGASLARPAFDALMAQVRAKEIDALVVEDVSRLSRDQADALSVYRELKFLGVRLVTVADAIDSTSRGAKLAYSVKALMSDLYRDDLADKTLRGMEGRALAGLATGGRLYGYRTVAIGDVKKPSGFRIERVDEQVKVVCRIFEAYLAGQSVKEIARALNRDQVGAPRASAGTRHKLRPAWSNSTVAAILANERYAGVWRFGERKWEKVPGSNKRVSRPAPPEAVVVQQRPDLAIVDRETWDAVASRRATVRATFTRSTDGKPKGRALSGRVDRHPLSGLLFCVCGAPMTVSRGGSRDYLQCADSKRGRCHVKKSLREDVAISSLMNALRERLTSSEGVAYARKRIVEELAEVARGQHKAAEEVRARMARTERRLGNLTELLAEGDRSESVRTAVRDLEAQRAVDRSALAELEKIARQPVRLPSVEDVLSQVFDLTRAIEEEPVAAREALRGLFKDGRIELKLGPDEIFTAETELLPLVLFGLKSENAGPLDGIPRISAFVAGACSGRRNTCISWPFSFRCAA